MRQELSKRGVDVRITVNKMRYVIIGNSIAGIGGIEGIRSIDKDGEIILISEEPYRVYSRPLISYLLAGKITDEKMYYREEDFYDKNGVKVLFGEKAKEIDPKSKEVVTEKDTIRYDKLLLTVGGKPFIPPIKGIQKRGVFTFAGWDDVKAIGDFLRENDAKRSVIVGGGMIGIKSAEALKNLRFLAYANRRFATTLRECGLNVTIVELMERILPMALDEEGGKIYEEHLIENGIDIITGDGIEEILGEDEVSGVKLKSGKRIECRIVIVAIGVHPNIELAESAGLKVDRGIKVDRVMQTSKKDIYAAGDCVKSYNILLEEEMPIPILPLAYKGGFTAGVNMAGGKGRSEYHGGFPMNSIQAFDLPLISLGMVNPDGGCEVLSARDGKNYKRLVLKDGKIFGYLAIGNIDRAGIVAGMMKEGMNVEKFKEAIMEDDFGLIYLPKDIRDNKLRG